MAVKFLRYRNEGSLLVESIIAIQVTLIGLLGVLGLLSNSLALNRDAGQKFIASYLAAEGVEVVKNLIDSNYVNDVPWNDGLNKGSYSVEYDSSSLLLETEDYLRFKDGVYSYDADGEATMFKRVVEIENLPQDEIKVVSTITWLTKRRLQSVAIEDHFFNWR